MYLAQRSLVCVLLLRLSYCLQILRMPLFQLPQLISQLVNAQVAITRLREFLAAAEQHTMPETEAAQPGQLFTHVIGKRHIIWKRHVI